MSGSASPRGGYCLPNAGIRHEMAVASQLRIDDPAALRRSAFCQTAAAVTRRRNYGRRRRRR